MFGEIRSWRRVVAGSLSAGTTPSAFKGESILEHRVLEGKILDDKPFITEASPDAKSPGIYLLGAGTQEFVVEAFG